MVLLRLENIEKVIQKEKILRKINLQIEKGDFIAIIGPSGSGKSSLLYIMGLLDKPTSGKILYQEREISWKNKKEVFRFRNKKLGFVFQFHYLIPELTVEENVMVPLIKKGVIKREAKERARSLLSKLGLEGKEERSIFQISGGEMQRVAIARALANSPEILLCDEPTGNLDSKNTEKVMRIFKEINKEGTTIVMVTHDLNLAKECKKLIEMQDGIILSELIRV